MDRKQALRNLMAMTGYLDNACEKAGCYSEMGGKVMHSKGWHAGDKLEEKGCKYCGGKLRRMADKKISCTKCGR